MKQSLNPIEKEIIKTMLQNKFPLSTSQIAKKSKISWNTAERHLTRLSNQKLVRVIEEFNKKKLWKTKIIKRINNTYEK
jgi:predicted ArsR family transcriptional regulator